MQALITKENYQPYDVPLEARVCLIWEDAVKRRSFSSRGEGQDEGASEVFNPIGIIPWQGI
jgi:hypothetical protein